MEVEHVEAESRFIVRLGEEVAELAYSRPGRGVMDIHHTFVPESSRGQGVAEALATAAFQHARERGDRVIPSCPFVRGWLADHPEEAAVVDTRYEKAEERPRPSA